MTRKKRISKRQFVSRFTALAAEHLSKLPVSEQDARLETIGRILKRRGARSTPSQSVATPVSPLLARDHREAP